MEQLIALVLAGALWGWFELQRARFVYHQPTEAEWLARWDEAPGLLLDLLADLTAES